MDSFARQALWSVGLDYNHGTGHGVGAYLNVHEGPQGISFRDRPNECVSSLMSILLLSIYSCVLDCFITVFLLSYTTDLSI